MPTPTVVELIPSRLHAAVFSHLVTVRGLSLSCRTCMTHGLRKDRQRDLVVTRVAPPGESIDEGDAEVFRFFTRVFEGALEGQLTTPGSFSRFDLPFLGAAAANAVAYVEADSFPGVPVDDDALAVIVLHPDEAEVAATYGAARVLARLGRQAGYHPFPRWWDPSRPSVAHPDDATGSVLSDLVRVAVPEGSVASRDGTIVLRLPAETREGVVAVLERLSPGDACALLVPPASDTDASLVWAPGQTAIAATSSSGRRDRVGGNFVLLAPGHPRDQGAPLEDGFGLRLRPETWTALLAAVQHGRGVILDAGDADNLGLRLEWTLPPVEPIDKGPARLERVVFLQPEAAIAREVSSRALSRYVTALRDAVAEHFAAAAAGPGYDLVLRAQLDHRRRPALDLGVRPLPPPRALDGLAARLERIAAPEVRGPVGVQLTFSLHGGSGLPE